MTASVCPQPPAAPSVAQAATSVLVDSAVEPGPVVEIAPVVALIAPVAVSVAPSAFAPVVEIGPVFTVSAGPAPPPLPPELASTP